MIFYDFLSFVFVLIQSGFYQIVLPPGLTAINTSRNQLLCKKIHLRKLIRVVGGQRGGGGVWIVCEHDYKVVG